MPSNSTDRRANEARMAIRSARANPETDRAMGGVFMIDGVWSKQGKLEGCEVN
jgi:hypothetical protein